MDGYLLSNFLGRFDAPRWNMISPEEIDRVDVLYGPFSALYPGNSIGTTVQVRTRRPEQRELSVRTTAFGENFDQYGASDDYSGYQASGFFGDRFDNGAWFSLAANHQDSTGHPMQYYTVSETAPGTFPSVPVAAPPTPVTGVVFDTDPFGKRRAVFGANAGAIDHTIQNQWKLRGGYALTDWLEAEGFLAEWANDTENENRTFMRDTAGQEVWQGRWCVTASCSTCPPVRLRRARATSGIGCGARRCARRATAGWNGSAVFSEYRILEDFTLQANNPDPLPLRAAPARTRSATAPAGRHSSCKACTRRAEGDWTDGAHTLAFGYHRNDYKLESPTYNTTDWRSRAGTLAQDCRWRDEPAALYAQDAWAFADRWLLTLGVRTKIGKRAMASVRLGTRAKNYPSRTEREWSPKASLSFRPDDAWQVRLSAGRGVRFPTVAELFLGAVTPSQIVVNDPNLKPRSPIRST
jgi:iron complex outermembrane receptor protein